nr:hypothetical protein CFP56_11228 [Quercus suber]
MNECRGAWMKEAEDGEQLSLPSCGTVSSSLLRSSSASLRRIISRDGVSAHASAYTVHKALLKVPYHHHSAQVRRLCGNADCACSICRADTRKLVCGIPLRKIKSLTASQPTAQPAIHSPVIDLPPSWNPSIQPGQSPPPYQAPNIQTFPYAMLGLMSRMM